MPRTDEEIQNPVPEKRKIEARVADASSREGFGKDWLVAHGDYQTRYWLPVTFLLVVIAAVFSAVVGPEDPTSNPVFLVNVAAAVAALVGLLWPRQIPRAQLLAGIQILLVSVFAYRVHQALSGSLSMVRVLAPATTFVTLATLFTILSPLFRFRYSLMTAAYFWVLLLLAGSAGWSNPEISGAVKIWCTASTMSLLVAIYLKYLHFRAFKVDAEREWTVRQQMITVERAKHEHELELARQIQGSFIPDVLTAPEAGFSLIFIRESAQVVGGDWSAARVLDDGSLVIIAIDAAGKGIQAALVVHAVQSIWASSLESPDFSPVKWLNEANRVFNLMGKATTHMVTVGLAVIKRGRLSYYSAGHPPLFLVGTNASGQREVTRIVARGNPLGVLSELRITAKEFDFSGLADVHILLGTDGLFPLGVHTKAESVTSIVDRLAAGQALAANGSESDDRYLIWLKKSA